MTPDSAKTGEDRILLYTDGACSGNPGPGGWAALLVHPASGRRREISGAEASTTNNRMELTAVIEGLRLIRRPSRIDVFCDSRYVVQGMNEWIHDWIRRGWKTAAKKPVLNEDLWKTLADLVEGQQEVSFQWIEAHSGHPENERCDRLAVEAYRRLLGEGASGGSPSRSRKPRASSGGTSASPRH